MKPELFRSEIPMTAPEYARNDGKPISVIEYQKTGHRWLPHSVEAGGCWDFNVTADGEVYYQCSGSGCHDTYELGNYCNAPKLCAKIWHNPALVTLTVDGKPATRASAKSRGYQIIHQPLNGNPFDDAHEGEVEYCNQCHGYQPRESTCRHLQYEEGCGYTLGCGAQDLNVEETKRSLFRFLRLLPDKSINDLSLVLESGRYRTFNSDSLLGGNAELELSGDKNRVRFYLEPLGAELNYEERYWPGIAWLQSLERDALKPIALTIGWLWEFQHTNWQNNCVLGNLTLHHTLSPAELDKWYARDPFDADFSESPLVIKIPFKVGCANDHQFLKDPKGTAEVYLRDKNHKRNLTFSVADVKLAGRVRRRSGQIIFREAHLHLGRLLQKDGKHISTMEDYQITRRW